MQKNDLGKDKYRAMIEALGEGVLLVTKKHRIALSNKSAEELLSWASPLVGKDIEKIFDDSTLSDAIDSVFKEKERKKIKITSYHSYTGDRAIIRGKGREKHYKSYITSLDDKHVVVTIMDVTRIERLAIVRQDFVSNVSHELKTPLTAISGFAETLLDDSLSREEMKGFARIIQKNSAHMQRIISDLLLLTSLDRSEMATSMAVTTDERIPTAVAIENASWTCVSRKCAASESTPAYCRPDTAISIPRKKSMVGISICFTTLATRFLIDSSMPRLRSYTISVHTHSTLSEIIMPIYGGSPVRLLNTGTKSRPRIPPISTLRLKRGPTPSGSASAATASATCVTWPLTIREANAVGIMSDTRHGSSR